MELNGKTVLHVMNRSTRFGAAAFITDSETAEATWKLYDRIQASEYAGNHYSMHADQGWQFTDDAWATLTQSAGINLTHIRIEAYKAVGSWKRYHAFFNSEYRRVHAEDPELDRGSALAIAVSADDQTAGPGGSTLTLLVCGVITHMPIALLKLPTQARYYVLVTVSPAKDAQVARTRIHTALSTSVPAAADRVLQQVTNVLDDREVPVYAWEGPFTVVVPIDKTVSVVEDGRLNTFSVDKVKAYRTPSAGTSAAQSVLTPGTWRRPWHPPRSAIRHKRLQPT